MSLKLDTPFFSKESMIAAVSRGSLSSPDYLDLIAQKYHLLAAKYSDALNISSITTVATIISFRFISLSLDQSTRNLMWWWKRTRMGLCLTPRWTIWFIFLVLLFSKVLSVMCIRLKRPQTRKEGRGLKLLTVRNLWRNVKLLLWNSFLLSLDNHPSPNLCLWAKIRIDLMKSASEQFPESLVVSTTCCHPHSAIQGIYLDMARCLDQMATLLTGLPIRTITTNTAMNLMLFLLQENCFLSEGQN